MTGLRINAGWTAPEKPEFRRKAASGFGAELDRLMAERDLSQWALADLLDCSPTYVSRLVLGNRKPSSAFVQAIIDALELGDVDAARLAVLGLTPCSCHDYLTGLIDGEAA